MKEYTIKAHSTLYKDVIFRSRLEARWAAFFDLANFVWEYEPIDLEGWTPDFRIEIPCKHSECNGKHILLVEVKPYFNIDDFIGHPCLNYPYGIGLDPKKIITADASAAFGANPRITQWIMSHGSGGGIESIYNWVSEADYLWKVAGNIVQYKAKNSYNQSRKKVIFVEPKGNYR